MRCILGPAHRDVILRTLSARRDGRMLEWGSGGSTLWFADRLPPWASLTSVEHDPAWHARVAAAVGERENVRLLLRPASGPLGRNATEEEESAAPLRGFIDAVDGESFDVIFVDGYARSACLEKARRLLRPDGVVFLHDAQRPWYDAAKAGLIEHGTIGSCPEYPSPILWWGGAEGPRPGGSAASLPVVVSFYTKGTPYEGEARGLVGSLDAFGLEHEVRGVQPLGSWERNCAHKPKHILEAYRRLDRPVLWLDADAVVRARPMLLAGCDADFAVSRVDGWEFNSATVYFNRTAEAERLLEDWTARCERDPQTWDQVHLDAAWEGATARRPLRTLWLPPAYARIFDRADAADRGAAAVIEQFQASRRFKAEVSSGPSAAPTPADDELRTARRAGRPRRAWYDARGLLVADGLSPAGPRAAVPPAPPAPRVPPGPGWNPEGVGAAPVNSPRPGHGVLAAAHDRLRLRLIDAVAERCAASGYRRVALYGAGRHTPPIVRQPWAWRDVRVVAILDDDPRTGSIRGVPVIRPAGLVEPIDAVIVSSDAHEDAIYARAVAFFGPRGVPVVRIYGGEPACEAEGATRVRLVEQWGVSDADARWLAENRAERHDATLPVLPPERTELHLRRYEFAARFAPGRGALDAACGTGYGAAVLLAQGRAAAVTGVDIDARAVDYARRRFGAGEPRLSFACVPAERTGLAPGSVGLVVSFETVEHTPDPAALLGEFARVLEPGGTLVLSTPNDAGLTEHHLQSLSRERLAPMLRQGFTDPRWFGQRADAAPAIAGVAAGITPWEAASPRPETILLAATRRA